MEELIFCSTCLKNECFVFNCFNENEFYNYFDSDFIDTLDLNVLLDMEKSDRIYSYECIKCDSIIIKGF
jgi:hypothetical protein